MTNEAQAAAALEEATTTPRLLATLAESLVALLGAEACLISRAIGEMLVDLVEHTRAGALPGGHGYLISDFPATQRLLQERIGATVHVEDADADPQEVQLLRQLGFAAVLMVPIVVDDTTWGLVEVYGSAPFETKEIARVSPLVDRAGELIGGLGA